MTPSVGRIVHYVARGSADGVFLPVCRAAIITELDDEPGTGEGYVGLAVLNPTGVFFDRDVAHGPAEEPDSQLRGPAPLCDGAKRTPGTWHWPARVE